MKNGVKISLAIAGVILVIVVIAILGFAGKWWSAGKEVVSPDNTKAQHRQIIDTYESVQTGARNACQAEKSMNTDDTLMVEDPTVAYGATVMKQVDDYNARMQDIFRAKIVAPHGYPDSLPRPGADENWCDYGDRVAKMRE